MYKKIKRLRAESPGERGRAVHAGKILCTQSSLVKIYADRPTFKIPRRFYAEIQKLKGILIKDPQEWRYILYLTVLPVMRLAFS